VSETTNAPTTEKTPEKTAQKSTPISKDAAEDQIGALYDAFDVPMERGPRDLLIKAAMNGRLEITGAGDDIKIQQRLKRAVAGQSMLTWNWLRLGMGKAQMSFMQGDSGSKLAVFDGQYKMASPMVGIETTAIHGMHPADLTVLEDVAAFFQAI
jgi:hypothetical protein